MSHVSLPYLAISCRFKRGISLPEIMVAILIMLLLVMTLYSVFRVTQQSKVRAEDRAELVQNFRAIIDRLVRELRQANIIVATLPAHEILFEDGHGNLDNTPLQYLRYHLTGTQLWREVRYYYFSSDPTTHVQYNDTDVHGNSPTVTIVEDRLVGEYLSSLTFSGSGIITVTATFLKNGQAITLKTDVVPRNLQ